MCCACGGGEGIADVDDPNVDDGSSTHISLPSPSPLPYEGNEGYAYPPLSPPSPPPPRLLTPQGLEYANNPWGLSAWSTQGCPSADRYGAPSDGEADWLGKMMDACYQKYTAPQNGDHQCHGIRLVVSNCTSTCLLYTSPSPRDRQKSRMPSSA